MIIEKIKNLFKNVNKKILKIMKYGLNFSFIICIVATAILCTYLLFYHDSFLYSLGLTSFRIGIILGIEFIICGLSVDAIKNYGI
jgi:hypothetical protein